MESRRFDAVIFDLFGTLLYNRPWGDEMNRAVAETLGAPVDAFLRVWARTAPSRTIGAYPSVGENVKEVCRELGVTITPEQVECAVAIRLDYTRRNLVPKEGAVELLRRLRDMCLKAGLLSNCTPEIPVLWPERRLARSSTMPSSPATSVWRSRSARYSNWRVAGWRPAGALRLCRGQQRL
jgi:putative hydrolase of the HAD superfamily